MVYEARGPKQLLEIGKDGALHIGEDFLEKLSEDLLSRVVEDNRSDAFLEMFAQHAETVHDPYQQLQLNRLGSLMS